MEDLKKGVKCLLHGLADKIARGERVEIRGFGIFELRLRPGRTARNPRSGHPVQVEDQFVILFKPSRELCEPEEAAAAQMAPLAQGEAI
jgi:integration host factor subunit beta